MPQNASPVICVMHYITACIPTQKTNSLCFLAQPIELLVTAGEDFCSALAVSFPLDSTSRLSMKGKAYGHTSSKTVPY